MIGAAASIARRGFTLLEMVVVLSILGLATAIAAPAVIRSIASWQRQGEIEAVLDQVRGLPAIARAQGRAIAISKESLASGKPPVKAGAGSTVTVDQAFNVHHNGVCEDGTIRLQGAGRPSRIRVSAPFCDPSVVAE